MSTWRRSTSNSERSTSASPRPTSSSSQSTSTLSQSTSTLSPSTSKFADVKAHLGVKIEAVDAKVALVLEAVVSLQKLTDTNVKDHKLAQSTGNGVARRSASA